MSEPTTGLSREHRGGRLAGTDDEIVVSMTRGPKFPQATVDDVEGHRLGGTDDEIVASMTRGPKFPQATGDEDRSGPDGAARR